LRILREYGEERAARRVVGAIVRRRERSKISSTDELADVVAGAVGRRRGIHPATKTFQAIRIEVNGELESLELAVPQAIGGLRSGGRLAIISYHSGEERVVKRTFGEFEKGCVCPAWFPVCKCGRVSEIEVLTKKAIRPSEEEVKRNPRSRSGRMRVCARKGTERGT